MSQKPNLSKLTSWMQAIERAETGDPEPDPPFELIRALNKYVADNPGDLKALRDAASCNILSGNILLGVCFLCQLKKRQQHKSAKTVWQLSMQLDQLKERKEVAVRELFDQIPVSKDTFLELASLVQSTAATDSSLSSLQLTESCAQLLGLVWEEWTALHRALLATELRSDFAILAIAEELNTV